MSQHISSEDFLQMIGSPVVFDGVPEWHVEWIVEPFIQKGAFNILGGVQKIGKSLLRSHLIVSAVTGHPALKCHKVNPAKKVLLLAGEEGRGPEHTRLYEAKQGLGVGDGILPVYIMENEGFYFDDDRSFSAFIEFVREQEFDLVVIDPLIRWHRKNENVAGEIGPILTRLRRLHKFSTVLLVHHFGKSSEDFKTLGHMLRGSSDIPAVYDHLVGVLNTNKRDQKGFFVRRLEWDTRYGAKPDPVEIEFTFSEHSYEIAYHKDLREAVLAILVREPLSGNEVVKRLHRQKKPTLAMLKAIANEGLIESTENGWRKK